MGTQEVSGRVPAEPGLRGFAPEPAAQSQPEALVPSRGDYLLVKRGLYYRPDNHGYTGIKSEAGRYHESDAYPDGGVTAIHQDDAPLFSPACWNDVKVKYLLGIIDEQSAALEAILKVRVEGWENIWAGSNRCQAIAAAALAKVRYETPSDTLGEKA